MAKVSVDPLHIRQAKAALAEAGIPAKAGIAALNLARKFYLDTPQVSTTDSMRKERNVTQDELERVSEEVLLLRKKVRDLQSQAGEVEPLNKKVRALQYELKQYKANGPAPAPAKNQPKTLEEALNSHFAKVSNELRKTLWGMANAVLQLHPDSEAIVKRISLQLHHALVAMPARTDQNLAALLESWRQRYASAPTDPDSSAPTT